jgi:hypothetical protein
VPGGIPSGCRRAGIPLDAATWEELVTAGEAMGLAWAHAQVIAGPGLLTS